MGRIRRINHGFFNFLYPWLIRLIRPIHVPSFYRFINSARNVLSAGALWFQ